MIEIPKTHAQKQAIADSLSEYQEEYEKKNIPDNDKKHLILMPDVDMLIFSFFASRRMSFNKRIFIENLAFVLIQESIPFAKERGLQIVIRGYSKDDRLFYFTRLTKPEERIACLDYMGKMYKIVEECNHGKYKLQNIPAQIAMRKETTSAVIKNSI